MLNSLNLYFSKFAKKYKKNIFFDFKTLGEALKQIQGDSPKSFSWGKRGDTILTTLEFIKLSVCLNYTVTT